MSLFGKPKNRWGWVRVAAGAALGMALAWTLLAALLRAMGDVTWMAWSGYPAFTVLDGFELAVLPFLVGMLAGWLEEHDLRSETEQLNHHEAERQVAAQRKEILHRLEQALLADPPHSDAPHRNAVRPEGQARLRIQEAVQAAAVVLDGKGKGEMLHFLFEKGLLKGDSPVVEMGGVDLAGAAMHKAHLEAIGLARADLRKARLDGAHLSGSLLTGAKLNKAHLRHADLRGAQLGGCNLAGARLDGANLEGADLREAHLEGAFLINTNLKNCSLGVDGFKALEQAILVDTVLPDGQKMTNERGKEYLRNKEIAVLVDRL